MRDHNYFVYIITNPGRKVLYTGVTNDLETRTIQHYQERGLPKTFAGKYYCYNIVHFERYEMIEQAIAREKEIKGWTREKKLKLIQEHNPQIRFLNADVMEWPPLKKDTSSLLRRDDSFG